MIVVLRQLFTITALAATLLGIVSSGIWFASELTDTRPPFGRYSLTIEPDTRVKPGGEYWAKWNIERLRGDCRIGYVTVLFDADGKEYVLDSAPLGPPSKPEVHPGEVRSYSRKYAMPADASPGKAGMTSRIEWVCNDVRQAFGLVNFGHYNTAHILVELSDLRKSR
jgi:hypothetical protein